MRNGLILSALWAATTLACAHEKPKPETPAAQPRAVASRAPKAPEAATHSCSADTDCAENQLCIRSTCVDITADLAECGDTRVQFDFNQADIHPDDALKLQRTARCLKVLDKLHVTIEGNADERGTEEWNLALGDRRATAVEDYLERLGVSKAQLKKVSYGKDHPLCTQHNEECWAKNRRAAVKPK